MTRPVGSLENDANLSLAYHSDVSTAATSSALINKRDQQLCTKSAFLANLACLLATTLDSTNASLQLQFVCSHQGRLTRQAVSTQASVSVAVWQTATTNRIMAKTTTIRPDSSSTTAPGQHSPPARSYYSSNQQRRTHHHQRCSRHPQLRSHHHQQKQQLLSHKHQQQ
ncbi:GD10866 [Drosophila simulans]|uniref:GD10866 n=1 Tax=Drosophila simulans TaxID=7240 RepID=B4NV85_DROSI|nr:GD10866 [Drosophila simulans]